MRETEENMWEKRQEIKKGGEKLEERRQVRKKQRKTQRSTGKY